MRRTHFWLGAGASACLVLASLATTSTPATATPRAHRIVFGEGGHRADPGFGPAQRTRALASAERGLARTTAALRLPDQQELVVKDVERDADGTTHVRYDRTYDGMPVIGGDLIVHQAPSGTTRGVDWASPDAITVRSVAARVSAANARGARVHKVIFAANHEPVLAWEGHVTGFEKDGTPIDDLVYTDAGTGKRLGVTHT